MMVLGIQVLGVAFGLFIIYLTFLYRKRGEFTLNEKGFWTLLAMGFMFISLFPQVLDPVVRSLSLARTMDLFIILGFMLLIGVSFYTYSLVRRTQKKIEEIVRQIALEGMKPKNEKEEKRK